MPRRVQGTMPPGKPPTDERGSSADMAHQLINTLTGSGSEPDDAVVSALGEFRSEYIKELSKRLADNAGDRVFGRDPEPSTHPQQAKVRETDHITHFEFNSALLRPGERDALVRYAADLVRQTGCHVMIHPKSGS
jgi:hypothetical protein